MKPVLSTTAMRLRWNTILPHIQGSVLDIGCGWTSLPDLLSPFQGYTGIDGNADLLAADRQKYPMHTFIQCDLDTGLPDLGDQRFDTIVMTAVIEHLRFPQKPLEGIAPLLKPGAKFLLTTPSPWGDLVHKVGGRLGMFYSEDHVAHQKIFKKRELIALLHSCGLQVIEFRYFAAWANQLAVCKSSQ